MTAAPGGRRPRTDQSCPCEALNQAPSTHEASGFLPTRSRPAPRAPGLDSGQDFLEAASDGGEFRLWSPSLALRSRAGTWPFLTDPAAFGRIGALGRFQGFAPPRTYHSPCAATATTASPAAYKKEGQKYHPGLDRSLGLGRAAPGGQPSCREEAMEPAGGGGGNMPTGSLSEQGQGWRGGFRARRLCCGLVCRTEGPDPGF